MKKQYYDVKIFYLFSSGIYSAFALGSNDFRFIVKHFSVYLFLLLMIVCRKYKWCVLFILHRIRLYLLNHTNVCSAVMKLYFGCFSLIGFGEYFFRHSWSLWFLIWRSSITYIRDNNMELIYYWKVTQCTFNEFKHLSRTSELKVTSL